MFGTFFKQDLKEICKPSTAENAIPSGTTEVILILIKSVNSNN